MVLVCMRFETGYFHKKLQDDTVHLAREDKRGDTVRRNESEWKKNVKKRARNSAESKVGPHRGCDHKNTPRCHISSLTDDDIEGTYSCRYNCS